MKSIKSGNFAAARSLLAALLVDLMLGGCSTYPGWLPSDGPNREQVQNGQGSQRIEGIQLVDVNDAMARKLLSERKKPCFQMHLAGLYVRVM